MTLSTYCERAWPNCATVEPVEPGLWDAGDADPAAARADLDAAVAAHQQAIADCETHRKVAEAAAKTAGGEDDSGQRRPREAERRAVRTDRRTRDG